MAAIDYQGGGAGCDFNDPQLQFSLMDGSTQHVLASGLDPCTAAAPSADITVNGVNIRVATLASPAYQWTGGPTMGIQVYNAQGNTRGNDGALDDPQIVDVTPQLDKAFNPTTAPARGTSTLTYTVTNTKELAAKDGWSFTDSLPSGLTVANNAASTTCPGGAVNAVAGSGTVSVTGNLTLGMTSCTITVNVTAAAGLYTNGASNITSSSGLNPPGPSQVEFLANSLTVLKALSDARLNPGDQFTVAVRQGTPTGPVVNDTTTSTTTGTGADVVPGTGTTGATEVNPATAYFITESGSGTTDLAHYTSSIACADANGVQTSGLPNGPFNGSAQVIPDPGVAISCTLTNLPQPASAISVVKKGSSATASRAGDTLAYTYTVTNTGNTTLTNVGVTDAFAAPAAVTRTARCASTTLGPAGSGTESTTCSGVSYTLTQADVAHGSLDNTATVSGTPSSGTPVTGTDRWHVDIPPAPSIEVTKKPSPTTVSKAGDTITYSYTVTNTGNTELSAITVTDAFTLPAGPAPAVSCPTITLAPGESTTCHSVAGHTVTAADISSGSIRDTATAQATTPTGATVTSPPAGATVSVATVVLLAALPPTGAGDPARAACIAVCLLGTGILLRRGTRLRR
jgi:uncharacterized repeat protein (TIGR01451 family)/fimbrial isopeptide formation D2 family protein